VPVYPGAFCAVNSLERILRKAVMGQKWKRVYLGIGSNRGNRKDNIFTALSRLASIPECRIIHVSSLYETKPVGGPPQRQFLNGVAVLMTSMKPEQLFSLLKLIETMMGRRKRSARWGPRCIDLDILLYSRQIVQEQRVTIPHPSMHKRAFVLVPFAEIAPKVRHPVLKKTVERLLYELNSQDVVRI